MGKKNDLRKAFAENGPGFDEMEKTRRDDKSGNKDTNKKTSNDNISAIGKRATFYIRPKLLVELKVLSARTGTKQSELVNDAIRDLLEKCK